MAAQPDASSTDLSVEMVGNAFVSQYYRILHQTPDLVYRFYQDSSTVSRPGPDGDLVTVTTMEEIKDLILSLESKDYKAEILTADTQASHMDGVIVLVTGCLTGKDNVRRKFTESFFLAPQEKGYYVLNDVFRFIEEDSSPVHSVEEKVVDESATVSPVLPVEETVEAKDITIENHAAAAEAKTETSSIAKDEPKPTVTEVTVADASADSSSNVQPVAETLSNGHLDAPKKSYASLLKNMKGGATTTFVHAPSTAPKAAIQNTSQKSAASSVVQQSRAAPAPAATSESSAPNGSNGVASNIVQAEDQVEQAFKKFGRIRRNGIQVRSNKGYCFGFVEYEDANGKQNAIDAGKLFIGGREAFIEEKKTSTRVVNGVSMYPQGRGGFRNDGFRGRGNFANGGRGFVRNDFGKRNGEVPSRGSSRNGDGYVYQNGGGGGRGNRQGAAPK
ncbi:putative G3BP-like protein [Bienertia sinuspersici]